MASSQFTPGQVQTPTLERESQGGVAEIVPLSSCIGAEVRGLDLAQGIDDVNLDKVRAALDRYSVVILRDQILEPQQQLAFSQRLGTVIPLMYSRYSVPGHHELTIISNIKGADGESIGIEDAGMLWHTDSSFKPCPDMYTLLYGIEIPHRDGVALGDTAFASVSEAYLQLPEDLRRRLIGLRSTHSYLHHLDKKRDMGQLKRAPLTEEQKAQLPDVQHPVVRRHPNTGAPCLFVSEGHTKQIEGLSDEESDVLLNFLWEHIRQPSFQYRHNWRKGDLVIWDNCAVQHLAIFDYSGLPRRLNRAGTVGATPVAWKSN